MDKHFIVLNGKRYDAVTGALLGSATDVTSPARTTKTTANPHLSRMQPAATRAKSTAHQTTAAAATPGKPRPTRTHHGQPKLAVTHRTQSAKTLMRRAVHKPTSTPLPTTKSHYPVAQKATGAGISPKLSVNTIDHGRMHRAQQVNKSAHVGRFANTSSIAIKPQVKPVAVSLAPSPGESVVAATQEVARKATTIFENAIANATSHEQPPHQVKKKPSKLRKRVLSSAAAFGAVLVIGGFLTYMNKATVQLQVASVQAGFQASMPGYAPEGFQRQAPKTADGAVAINFVAPSNNQSFTLTQESSDWDSQTLFDSVVAESNSSYQTVQSNGRTIYIYGNDAATWVDGGVLYKVDGSAQLNSDQIISLAASM